MGRKFYPTNRDARAAWHANWAKNLPGALATKYGISAATLLEVVADNDWIQFWTQARNDADAQKQALTRYFNDISGDDTTLAPPAPIVWQITAGAPVEVAPGMEARVYLIADQILGSMDYAEADGDLLGIALPDSGASSPLGPGDPVSPTFELKTLAGFELEASFKKQGNSAVKFQYRYIGGTWATAAVLLTSPGSFTVPPSAPGVGQQVEIRGIFLLGNEEVGIYSDAKSAFIAP